MKINLDNKTIFHHDMKIGFEHTEKGLWQSFFSPGNKKLDYIPGISGPSFQITIAGKPYGFCSAMVSGYTSLPLEMDMDSIEQKDDEIILTYIHKNVGLKVIVNMNLIPGINMIRQTTSVVNEGINPVTITHLSSICMNGIAIGGCRPWHDKSKIKLHYCRQTWEGEGQWRMDNLEELGLYPTSVHPNSGAIHLSSIGSYSTARYLPMAVIEDCETSEVWYLQIETSGNWHFEIGHRGSSSDSSGALFIHADGADERYGGWSKELQPGEIYSSIPVSVGCCKGDFNEAIKELTKYRRATLKPKKPWENYCPVIFNDYMNCLWGDPTKEKLIPLINSAKAVGCEVFCIDAGWFADSNVSWGNGLGDWKINSNRFGDEGLPGIISYIKSNGLIPGIWFEIEVCGEDAELGSKPDSWFLMRNGKRVGGGSRWFLNFSNIEVVNYLHNAIDNLIKIGIGYIKNDYNDCIGNGDDTGGNAAEGLITNVKMFYKFIDQVRERHPQLIIENCASGAMRQDYGILSHFHLQSTSDQEIYYKYPSILGGSLASILPEQAGIWAYPYPHLFDDRNDQNILKSESYKKLMDDGEQTIFNMINGLCGNMYLSGRIDVADEKNMNLIIEAVELYKDERSHIHNSFPFWPLGFTRINDNNSWATVGLATENKSRILLAVWRLGSSDEYLEIPLGKLPSNNVTVKQLYPSNCHNVKYSYNEYKGTLTVNFEKTYQARFFEISNKTLS